MSLMINGSEDTFPYKLFDMLNSVCDCNDESTLNCEEKPVAWLPDGNGFVILNEQAFLEHIIPVYFTLTKMRSLTRQLNLWGFKRIPSGKSKESAWKHPHFQRNDASQLSLVTRTAVKVKGIMSKRKLNKIVQDGHISQAEQSTALGQPIPFASTVDITNSRYIEPSKSQALAAAPNLPNMFLLGQIDSSHRPLDLIATTYQESLRTSAKNSIQTRDLEYSVISLEERTVQSNQRQAFSNNSFARDDPNVGFTFDSPIFQDYLLVPTQAPPLVASKYSKVNPIEQTAASSCMIINEDFGLGDDHYVVSAFGADDGSDITDEEFEHEVEGLSINAEQATEVSKSNKVEKSDADVSDIDFNAFMSKYFPSG